MNGQTNADGTDGLRVREAADIAPEAIGWLWQGNFTLGKVAVVAGAPGTGKTLLVARDLAACVSSGTAWADRSACPCGDVLIASGEDSAADTLVPRLVDHGADLQRVHFVDSRIALMRKHTAEVEEVEEVSFSSEKRRRISDGT